MNPLINLLYNKGFNVIKGGATYHVFHFSLGSKKSIALDIQADKQSKFDKVGTLGWSRLHRSGKAPMGVGGNHVHSVYMQYSA